MSNDSNTIDVFLSYNWRDQREVEVVASVLQRQGLTVFLDRWYLVPGLDWQQALVSHLNTCKAVAVFLGPDGLGPWQQREIELAFNRQARSPSFPVIPVLLPGADPPLGFLSLNTWVDLQAGRDDDLSLSVLAKAIRGEPPGPDIQERIQTTLEAVCPYRGLRSFREEDAPFFFGRELFTQELTAMVKRQSLVAVVGASGSGKSSVVRAGLVPYLRQTEINRVWEVATLVPGDRPLHALAAAFAPLLGSRESEIARLKEVNELANYLGERKVALRDMVDRALEQQPGTDRLLLIVDQWEELYTLTQDHQTRFRFVDELLEATVKGGLTVVITLRGDFYGHVLSYRPLSDRLQGAVINLGPMEPSELEQAIVSPARKTGLTFEAGLVKRMLDDLEGQPGNLPLLEFALRALWDDRRGGHLLNEAYEAMGKAQGAIARRADEVFEQLTPSEQEIARRVFLLLVRPGKATEDTRRRATFTEVGEPARLLVKLLADYRLVVTGRDESTGEEIVEVAHEALIRHWTRLRKWLDEDREFLLWRQRLRIAFDDWERIDRHESALLRGALLAEAKRWLDERTDDLILGEQVFIRTSEDEEAKRKEEAEKTLREVLRLADTKKLQDLIDRATNLWPRHPDKINAMNKWIASAEELTANLNGHRQALMKLRERANIQVDVANNSRASDSGDKVSIRKDDLARKEILTFASPALDWQHQVLSDLVEGLEMLGNEETGLLADIRKRLDFASTLCQQSLEVYKGEWERTIADITAKEIYGGLCINPQLGLVPLGPDPDSGFFEFSHIGSGDLPRRDSKTRKLIIEDNAGMVLVLVPGGEYWAGAQSTDSNASNYDPKARKNEGPVRKVRLDAFFLSKFQITQQQWATLTSGEWPSDYKVCDVVGGKQVTRRNPVEQVSWVDCSVWLSRHMLELPTELQWEYACRAGTNTPWHTGNDVSSLQGFANLADRFTQAHGGNIEFSQYTVALDSGHVVHAPVGSFEPNAFGLYDMHGNVFEWCAYDAPDTSLSGSEGNKVSGSEDRVLRGGAWFSLAESARSAARRFHHQGSRLRGLGVRPARPVY